MWMWWWLGFCVLVGCLFTGFGVARARARLKNPAAVQETGVLLMPVAQPGAPLTWRRVGAGMLVGRWGKVSATTPLVVLEVDGGGLTLRMRPAFVAAPFGARPLHASAADATTVLFPARGWFGSRYVGIRTGHGEGYFLTSRPEELLSLLGAAGFTATWAEQKITYP